MGFSKYNGAGPRCSYFAPGSGLSYPAFFSMGDLFLESCKQEFELFFY